MYKFIYWFKFEKHPQGPMGYKPVILVTGCSSGIGESIAELLVSMRRYRVVVTARAESLDKIKQKYQNEKSTDVLVLPLDVTNETSRNDCVRYVINMYGAIDILVNNAGICYRSVMEEMTYEDERLQMETNYLGPASLMRAVLPYMRRKGRGKIINISSVSGMLAMPTMASYSASKYALEGASEALWYEARPFGISVSLIQPGFVRSKSFERVRFTSESTASRVSKRPYTNVYRSMEPFIARLMENGLATTDSVAELVYNVIRTQDPPLWIPASFDAEFFYYLRRIFPRRLLQPFLFMCLPRAHTWGESFSKRRKQWFWPFQWVRARLQKL